MFFICFSTYAQKSGKKESHGEKIKALKIAFITEKLNLDTKEAEKFWPIYNKYNDLLYQLERVEKHKLVYIIKEANGIDAISEKEAKSIFEKNTNLDAKIHKIKMDYDNALTKVLSHKKILKLKITEREFIRNLMKKYRNKKI
ncbi:sensor of ECF-type sigma factor [Polaribacter ponticola]|uniref:Sensor of ECF-type sigma factor n=1 Tax=Polaribacter ponticola TaxID=2978475 RepID=A0ABT5SF11_9FLAO|nr:sensor of ECF-type sigma factor [Polaribacter sp. MSW5]MDD7916021.1 sensor of ECF-type sigma factor [Polaribacter sp. MSW5]